VTPVVTSVGGGSCSVGRREKWTCPVCKNTMHRSGCFVATATYGDEDAIEVRFLRVFRDTVLLRYVLGRAFVHAYYRTSPRIALVIERSPQLKLLARLCLDRIVKLAERLSGRTREDIRRSLAKHATAKALPNEDSRSVAD
jgi:hypothetical protein